MGNSIFDELVNKLNNEDGWEEVEGFDIVEDSGWQDEGKYAYREVVLFNPPTGVYIRVTQGRDGTYYTDYNYYDPEFEEVIPKTVEIIKYISK